MRTFTIDRALLIMFGILAVIALLMFAAAGIMLLQQNLEADSPTPIPITATTAPNGTYTPLATSAARTPTGAAATETLRPTPTQFVPGDDGPSKTSTAPAVTVVPGGTSAPDATSTSADAPGESARIFLIALGDDGESGTPAGCGDSLISEQRSIPAQSSIEARIIATLNALLSIREQVVGEDELYNAAYQSSLSVNSASMEGDTAVVAMSGTLRLNNDCDKSRFEAQVESTIGHVPGVVSVRVTLNGKPLEEVLYGGG